MERTDACTTGPREQREEPSYKDVPHLNTLRPEKHNLYSLHNDAKVKTLLWIKEG